MASVRMVTAVKRNDVGDVVEVEWRIANTFSNSWDTPAVRQPVIEVVDALMAGDEVLTRLPSGALGPRLRTTLAKTGQGVETIRLDHETLTVADLAQL